jgi:hypothetical protein
MLLGGQTTVFLPPPLHQRFVAIHAKYSLGRPGIAQVLNFLLAVPAPKALGTEGLFASQDG